MNLGQRVASAVVLLAALAAALWYGGVVVEVVVGLAVAVGAWEYAGLLRRMGAAPTPWVLYPLTGWLLYRFLLPSSVPALELGLGAAVVVGLIGALLQPGAAVLRWAAALGGALYLGLSIGYYLALLRWHGDGDAQHVGLRIVGLTLLAAMVGDTVALFAGSAVGRHRFFPAISPNKTVEGAAAGAAAAVAVYALTAPPLFGLAWYHAVVLGALVTVAAQGGDLVESALKRGAGVKDSSDLIPGHGGLLDRLDSLVLLGPVVYFYVRVIALP